MTDQLLFLAVIILRHTIIQNMAIENVSVVISGTIAALGCLTPLVKALHKWHIDTRKFPKSAKKLSKSSLGHEVIAAEETPKRMSNFDRLGAIWSLLGIISSLGFLLLAVYLIPIHPVTSRDVSQIGLMLACLILSTTNLNQILR